MQTQRYRRSHFAETDSGQQQGLSKRLGYLFRRLPARRRNLIVLLVLIVLATTIIAFTAYVTIRNTPTSPSSIDGIPVESGYTAVVGNKTASDGRISITVNNYHFEEAMNIDWVPPLPVSPTAVFMFVNVTVTNVGGGNTSIIPAWVVMQNGSSTIGNTNFVRNVSFPVGVFPNQAYPDNAGGIYLAPGKEATFWYLFYVPYSESLGLSGVVPTITLKALLYYEHSYGGTYKGDGSYGPPFQEFNPVQFIVLY